MIDKQLASTRRRLSAILLRLGSLSAAVGPLVACQRYLRTRARSCLRWLDGKLCVKCPEDVICEARTEYGGDPGKDVSWIDCHSIRSICIRCGKATEWERVIR